MRHQPNWEFDETAPTGVDYSDPVVVRDYDAKHTRFRDYHVQTRSIMDRLGLGEGDTVIDMGAGTGAFTLHAAPHCRKIHAVDVSKPMLDRLRNKAEAEQLTNIVYHHAGFLTYDHVDEPADVVVVVAVLHHLPDFWKLVGLKRVSGMLKPEGRLCVLDAVFPSDMSDHAAAFEKWIGGFAEQVGPDFASEIETHIRDEYSTLDWIMEGIIRQAGFHIEHSQYDGFGATYVCRRVPVAAVVGS